MRKKTIYFICTGNSCRSQMAEGWGKKILGEHWNVYSAGIETHGVNPKAIEAMQEVDIDISNHTSDLIDNNILKQSDLVVTLCSDADANCPILPPNVKKEHCHSALIWLLLDHMCQSFKLSYISSMELLKKFCFLILK